jgi:lysophospholipase L1-like esterase
MPRVEGKDIVYINKTWPKLLTQKLSNFNFVLAEFSERSRDTDSLKNPQLFYEAIECCIPKYVIIQIGIVDCAPRIISKHEHRLFNRFFFPIFIRDNIINFRKKRKLNILRKGSLRKVYVNTIEFENNYNAFVSNINKQFPNSIILIIPILGDYNFLNEISEGYSKNINIYNDILRKISTNKAFLCFFELIEKMNKNTYYTSDGYHLNSLGHMEIANEIYKFIVDSD